MSDPLADAVPEADLAEQSVPAYPEEPVLADDLPEQDELVGRAALERDTFEANPADVLEQSIAVPIDDDPEEEFDF
ncbi:hypothetical protein [Nocardia implantans]|uniref:Uncharacterized protein n=1 Tax=Nocardia implantans TaxID=3108168 RepID=A0ABU6B3X1_9NOCA|nr:MULTISPECIES: hypothetical protein [unclassified Nocardia]MBF6196054.1 hypothetical protein [Nocardia beijingensis]MEA3532573.1 hypothetical protein [Nocardia sp. CDC192]MEB3514394.1 hypothetical protein [Nocardia sp. CDC186]